MTAEVTLEALQALIYDVLRSELLEVGEDFTPQSNLLDAGLSSLAVVQLLLSVEEQTGIWMDESQLTPENLESAEALARCVYAQRGS
jgi:acyl carrier protein